MEFLFGTFFGAFLYFVVSKLLAKSKSTTTSGGTSGGGGGDIENPGLEKEAN
jgi:hypothetical protein